MIVMNSGLDEIEDFVQKNPAVLIYFSTDHCAPCISLRPKVSDLLQYKFPRMKIRFIDAVSAPEITGHFGVFASPTILIFFDGKESRRFSKYISVDELEQSIARYYKMIFED